MNLTVHNVYFCFSEVGCTISLRDGTPCKEVPAHTPTLFVAQQPDMVCSDPAAVVKEVPNGLQLLHGQMMKEQTPAWFAPLKAELTALLDGSKFELAWLASKNTLVVHTDRANDAQLAQMDALLSAELPEDVQVEKYNFSLEVNWRDVDKYAHCKNRNDMLAVNPDYANDLTSDGTWVYNLTALQNGLSVFKSNSKLKRFSDNVTFSALTDAGTDWSNAMCHGSGLTELHKNMNFCNMKRGVCFVAWTKLTEVKYDLGLINVTNLRAAFEGTKIKSFTSALPKLQEANELFNGVSALEEFDSELPSVKACRNAFKSCKLNKESSLRVLNSVPAYTSGEHLLTIGIHIDHQNDPDVLAAITNAEAKGWVMTVQWNGTPTAQAATTYGLRKPPIYAKVSEMENGERYLEWGHYVTDPTGYEEFRSVEAAREYFGLPEEDLTNN